MNSSVKPKGVSKIFYLLFSLLAAVSFSVLVHADYEWNKVGSVSAQWLANGIHTRNNNSGSIVIGDNHPSSGLLVDVAGQTGGVKFCDENGVNCFFSKDIAWTVSSSTMYSSNTGNVGIGVASSSQKLHVDGNVEATTFLYSSDRRLKKNIRHLDGLDVINQLEGVSFVWNDDDKPAIGLIAQDVEQVLPELVTVDQYTGLRSVQYANLVAPLIQALNEQQMQIDSLRTEIIKTRVRDWD